MGPIAWSWYESESVGLVYIQSTGNCHSTDFLSSAEKQKDQTKWFIRPLSTLKFPDLAFPWSGLAVKDFRISWADASHIRRKVFCFECVKASWQLLKLPFCRSLQEEPWFFRWPRTLGQINPPMLHVASVHPKRILDFLQAGTEFSSVVFSNMETDALEVLNEHSENGGNKRLSQNLLALSVTAFNFILILYFPGS